MSKTLMTLKQYQQCFSLPSRPSLRTLQTRCKQGHLPAQRQGRVWYVEVSHDFLDKKR